MAVNSVSAPSSALQQQAAAERQAQFQAAERPQRQEASRGSEAPPPENRQRTREAERPEQAQRPEPPRPVVNAQGQKTGTIINTSA